MPRKKSTEAMVKVADAIVVQPETQQGDLQEELAHASDVLATINSFSIDAAEDLDLANELLAEVKQRNAFLEDKKQAATAPLTKSLHEIRSWFRPAQDYYAKCERELKDKVAAYFVRREQENRAALVAASEAVAAGDSEAVTAAIEGIDTGTAPRGMSVRETWDFEVDDLEALPVAYRLPDTAKIRKTLFAALSSQGEPPGIPGVRFYRKTSVSVRVAK